VPLAPAWSRLPGVASRVAGESSAPPAGPPPAVTVATAARTCLSDKVYFTGVTAPREEVLVFPEAEGAHVAEVLITEGDRVTAGQVLAQLTDAPAGGANREGRTRSIDVTAPAAGLVIRRAARLGAVVSASSPEPLFRIGRDGEMVIEADVPEVHLARIAVGQTARADVLGVGTLTGRVLLVSPEIDRQTRLGRLRISVEAKPSLRFGAAAMGAVEIGSSCGVTVPVSALVSRREETVVQRVRDNRVETRAVQLGIVDGARAEIAAGLAEGDVVVSRAGTFVRDGEVVRPIPAATDAEPTKPESRK